MLLHGRRAAWVAPALIAVMAFGCGRFGFGQGKGALDDAGSALDAGADLPDVPREDAEDGAPTDGGPTPTDGCVVSAEICNGADDDCDLGVDEDFDLRTDDAHCGSCGNACNPSELCAVGACRPLEAERFAAGHYSTCVRDAVGDVRCFGENGAGQLGDGSQLATVRARPGPVTGLGDVVELAGAGLAVMARDRAGRLHCWGQNQRLQCGQGTTDPNVLAPVLLPAPTDVAATAMGYFHACAATRSGEVYCWGANDEGALSGPLTGDVRDPVRVGDIDDAIDVAAGVQSSCLLRAGGEVLCWGRNFNGQLGDGTTTARRDPVRVLGIPADITQIAAGGNHACALSATGTVWCWGANEVGQRGVGAVGNGLAITSAVGVTNATHVVAGRGHVCATLAGGEVRCWGSNMRGQLGLGTSSVAEPLPLESMLGGAGAVEIGAGYYHSCAYAPDGSARCTGWFGHGQLGDGRVGFGSTVRVAPGVTGTAVWSGVFRTCVRVGVELRCAGFQDFDAERLSPPSFSVTPITIAGIDQPVQHASSYIHQCVLETGGELKCWGANYWGMVGDGTYVGRSTPVVVRASGVVDVDVGYGFTCIVVAGGSVECTGLNTRGQLGDSAGMRNTFTPVSGVTGATRVVTGYDFACALVVGGGVTCWGANGTGELGRGTQTTSEAAGPVSGVTGASAIAAGSRHVCVVMGGGLRCWGWNAYGQSGQSGRSSVPTPASVAGLTGVVTVAAGGYSTCTLEGDGEVRCFGNNHKGVVGPPAVGTTVTSPELVTTSAGSLSVGEDHACALVGGGVACWGSYAFGEDGAGIEPYSRSPAAVLP